jgi:hypothetical protein
MSNLLEGRKIIYDRLKDRTAQRNGLIIFSSADRFTVNRPNIYEASRE